MGGTLDFKATRRPMKNVKTIIYVESYLGYINKWVIIMQECQEAILASDENKTYDNLTRGQIYEV